MRVVTWNLQHGRPNPDGPGDLSVAFDALRSLDADVFALQELDRGRRRSGRVDQPTALADALEGTLLWAPTVRRGGEYGIALVVRAHVVASSVVDLSGTREPRALLLADVEHDGRRWSVGCTHLSRDSAFARGQLERCMDAQSERPTPRVLVGDLNLVPSEVEPLSRADGYHLVDGPPTHSTRTAALTRRIDHVLVAGAEVTSPSVHRFAVSDHCAVSADLD